MRRAGRRRREMPSRCSRAAKTGVTTLEIEPVAREVLDDTAAPAPTPQLQGVPAVILTSPNYELNRARIPVTTPC